MPINVFLSEVNVAGIVSYLIVLLLLNVGESLFMSTVAQLFSFFMILSL